MRKNSRLAGLVVAVFSVFACGVSAAFAQDVTVHSVPGTDFSKYKTYRWVETRSAEKPDQGLDTQIKQAVEKVLASKGLTKVEGDAATLFIAYHVAVNHEEQWVPVMQTAMITIIKVGTVALDMYDPSKKELVWNGQARKSVDTKANPEKRQKNLDKAMTKLLKNFPPKPAT